MSKKTKEKKKKEREERIQKGKKEEKWKEKEKRGWKREKKKGNELPSPRIEMSRFPRHRGKLFLSSIAAKEQG